MTERQRQLFAWLILSLFALLAGYIVSSILGPVLSFITTVVLQVVDAVRLPHASTAIVIASRILMIAARCAAIGFAYRVFFEDPWRKAGLYAWAVILAWSALTQVPNLLFITVSGASALAGAWYAHGHRHNQHVRAVRDGLLGFLRID